MCSLRLPCWKCQNFAHAYIWTTIKSIVPLICWIFGRIPSSLILFFFCLFLEKSEVTVAILDDKAFFHNSAKVSELYPIKVHWLKNLAKLWAKVVRGRMKGLFSLLTLCGKTTKILNTLYFRELLLPCFCSCMSSNQE